MNVVKKVSTLHYNAFKMYYVYFFVQWAFSFVNSQTQNVNLLYINQKGNPVADDAINSVIEYVKQNPDLGVTVEKFDVINSSDDPTTSLESLCKTYTEMVDAKKPPDIVLDTTKAAVSSETAKSFTRLLGLPTIAGSFGQKGDLRQWRNLNDNEKKYLIQVCPPSDIISEIMKPIILNQNISNAAILFDQTFIMQHKIKSLFQSVAIRHSIRRIKDRNVREQLQSIYAQDIVNFFVIGNLTSVTEVLQSAAQLDYFNPNFAWCAISSEMNDVKCPSCRNATILTAKPTLPDKYAARNKMLQDKFQLKSDRQITISFYFDLGLNAILAARDFLKDQAWTLTYATCDEIDGTNTPARDSLDLLKYFYKNPEEPSFGPLNITENGESHMEFPMQFSAVQMQNGAIAKVTPLGTWPAGFGTNLSLDNPDIMSTYTVPKIYRISILVQPPFIFRDDSAPKKYAGFCIDMLNQIAAILNFDYTLILVPDKKFGNIDDNGNWDGMIKELMDQKVDIALAPMWVMSERENVIDFTHPYYDLVGFSILMKMPQTSTSLFKFLTVLENSVWLCILAAYFFTSLLMWIFDRWSPYSYQNNKEKYKDDEEKRIFDLKECLWFCMTSLTPQGGGEAPKNLSGRLVAATWWLFGFIIIASYTANLAAFLTVSRLDTPVESLDDLSKQYKIQYAPLNGSAAMTYFERMAAIENRFYEIWKDMSLNDSLPDIERAKLAVWDYPVSDKYTKMWQAMKEAGLPATQEEAVKRVRDSQSSSEGFAFISDATDIKYLEKTSCDLQHIGEEFSRKPYAIAVQQDSPLREQLNTAILELLNRRELERLKDKWWDNNPANLKCETGEGTPDDGIGIQNIGGVFIVIFVGIGMACGTLSVEFWWYQVHRESKIVKLHEPKVPSVVTFPKSNNELELQPSNLYRRYNNQF